MVSNIFEFQCTAWFGESEDFFAEIRSYTKLLMGSECFCSAEMTEKSSAWKVVVLFCLTIDEPPEVCDEGIVSIPVEKIDGDWMILSGLVEWISSISFLVEK